MLNHFVISLSSLCLVRFAEVPTPPKSPLEDSITEHEHDFPFTTSYWDVYSYGRASMAKLGSDKASYTRLTSLQWIFRYICDCIFGTDFASKILQPQGYQIMPNPPRERLAPESFSMITYGQCISYSKLSFCKVDRINNGTHYKDGENAILSVSSKDVILYQPFQTQVYGMRGYFLLHRIPPHSSRKNSNRQRLVIAFHASRNRATSRASCMIGLHKCEFCLGCKSNENKNECYVYLGWYATFASLIPKIEDILKDVLDVVGYPSAHSSEQEYIDSIDEIVITGPCMGGSMAQLTAVYLYHWLRTDAFEYLQDDIDLSPEECERLQESLYQLSKKIFVYTYGSPRVGEENFGRYYNRILGNNTYRIVNEGDGKIKLPLASMGFTHCGQEVYFSHDAQQWTHGQPRFSPASLNTLEDPTMGASVPFWRALAPPLRPHVYYSKKNIMKCT